ncbi:START domain-containing protein [Hymenobacter coalescens]
MLKPMSGCAAARENWRLETNKDGIKVYSRHSPGSRFKEIRVHCEMPGTLSQLVALYTDVDNYTQVISNTKRAHLLRRVSETELFYYIESQMPRPVANRDLVMRLQFAYSPVDKLLVIHTNSVNGMVAPQPDLVRVPSWTGQWTVRQVTDSRLQIDYTFRVDPGGELPTWLINMIAPVAPYSSFMKLRNGLQLPRYQSRSFAFLQGETAQR